MARYYHSQRTTDNIDGKAIDIDGQMQVISNFCASSEADVDNEGMGGRRRRSGGPL